MRIEREKLSWESRKKAQRASEKSFTGWVLGKFLWLFVISLLSDIRFMFYEIKIQICPDRLFCKRARIEPGRIFTQNAPINLFDVVVHTQTHTHIKWKKLLLWGHCGWMGLTFYRFTQIVCLHFEAWEMCHIVINHFSWLWGQLEWRFQCDVCMLIKNANEFWFLNLCALAIPHPHMAAALSIILPPHNDVESIKMTW